MSAIPKLNNPRLGWQDVPHGERILRVSYDIQVKLWSNPPNLYVYGADHTNRDSFRNLLRKKAIVDLSATSLRGDTRDGNIDFMDQIGYFCEVPMASPPATPYYNKIAFVTHQDGSGDVTKGYVVTWEGCLLSFAREGSALVVSTLAGKRLLVNTDMTVAAQVSDD